MLLVFGSSPYIKQVDVEKLLSKYQTLGLNYFGHLYKTDFWHFTDSNFINHYDHADRKIITSTLIAKTELAGEVFYQFKATKDISLEPNKLYMHPKSPSTIHSALNWALQFGYKDVCLIGIDLELDGNWERFYGNNKITSPTRMMEMREGIYKFKEYLNLYTANPNSTMGLTYIDL